MSDIAKKVIFEWKETKHNYLVQVVNTTLVGFLFVSSVIDY